MEPACTRALHASVAGLCFGSVLRRQDACMLVPVHPLTEGNPSLPWLHLAGVVPPSWICFLRIGEARGHSASGPVSFIVHGAVASLAIGYGNMSSHLMLGLLFVWVVQGSPLCHFCTSRAFARRCRSFGASWFPSEVTLRVLLQQFATLSELESGIRSCMDGRSTWPRISHESKSLSFAGVLVNLPRFPL